MREAMLQFAYCIWDSELSFAATAKLARAGHAVTTTEKAFAVPNLKGRSPHGITCARRHRYPPFPLPRECIEPLHSVSQRQRKDSTYTESWPGPAPIVAPPGCNGHRSAREVSIDPS
jgi:hypothetical protein